MTPADPGALRRIVAEGRKLADAMWNTHHYTKAATVRDLCDALEALSSSICIMRSVASVASRACWETRKNFGNTCVYIRRGGLSWGAVALNRQADDKKHGVFDLQAQHDRDMAERLGQVQRLIEDRDRERELRWKYEKELEALKSTPPPAPKP